MALGQTWVKGEMGFRLTVPQINDTFVHNLKDLALAEGRDAQIHVTRWHAGKRIFEKLIARPHAAVPDALN